MSKRRISALIFVLKKIFYQFYSKKKTGAESKKKLEGCWKKTEDFHCVKKRNNN